MRRLAYVFFILFPLSVSATDTCPAGYYPAEYVELEYIESTGTQYINTGIMLGEDYINTNIKLEYDALIASGSDWQVCGTQGGLGLHIGVNPTNIITYSVGSSDISTNVRNPFTKCKWINDMKSKNIKVIELSTGLSIVDINSNPVTTKSRVPIIMNGYSQGTFSVSGAKLRGLMYSFKIYNNNVLIRDFIPVRRVSDGAVGMFDEVNNKFYGNDGTGKFIAGPEKIGQGFITDENGDIICTSCPANTYKSNAGNEQCTKCPDGTFSPIGSKELSDCAKILRVKDYVVYMPLGKRTEHGLCVMWNGEKYCADVYKRE